MVTSRSATVSSLPPYSPALLDGSPTAPNAGTPRPQPDVGNNQNQGNLVVAPVEGTDPQDPPMSPGQILAGALISLAILLLGALIFGCAIIISDVFFKTSNDASPPVKDVPESAMMALTIAVVVMSFCGFLFFFIGLIWLIGCAALCHTYRSARNSVNEEGSVTNTDSLPFYGVRVERPVENEGSYAGTVKINSSDTLEMLVLSRRDNPTSGLRDTNTSASDLGRQNLCRRDTTVMTNGGPRFTP